MNFFDKFFKILVGLSTSLAAIILTPWNKIKEISFFNYKTEPSFKFDGNKALNDYLINSNEVFTIKNLKNEILKLKEELISKDLLISNLSREKMDLNYKIGKFENTIGLFFNENLFLSCFILGSILFASFSILIRTLKLKKNIKNFHEINKNNNQFIKELLLSFKDKKELENHINLKIFENNNKIKESIIKTKNLKEELKTISKWKIDNTSLKKKILNLSENSFKNTKNDIIAGAKNFKISDNNNPIPRANENHSHVFNLATNFHKNLYEIVKARKTRLKTDLDINLQEFITKRDIESLKRKSMYIFYNSIFAMTVFSLFKIGLLDVFRDSFLDKMQFANFLEITEDPYLKIQDFSKLNSNIPSFNELMLQESSRSEFIDLSFLDQGSTNISSLNPDIDSYKINLTQEFEQWDERVDGALKLFNFKL